MPKIEAFEGHSDAYDDWFERNSEAYAAELAAVRELLPETLSRAVEIGVGSGKFAAPLGIKVGVEPSPQMAKKAKQLGIDVFSGVAEALPFPAQQFDCVLMVTTICFVDDSIAAFREALRVLIPGGCIVVGFVDVESELGQKYLKNKDKSRFYQQATFFSTREVLDHLQTAGFGHTDVKQTLFPDVTVQTVRDGFGDGAFVVIKAVKGA